MRIVLAYVDPGLGLLAWQALVAAFLGVIFYLKKTRTWLMKLLLRPFHRPAPQPSREAATPTNDLRR